MDYKGIWGDIEDWGTLEGGYSSDVGGLYGAIGEVIQFCGEPIRGSGKAVGEF